MGQTESAGCAGAASGSSGGGSGAAFPNVLKDGGATGIAFGVSSIGPSTLDWLWAMSRNSSQCGSNRPATDPGIGGALHVTWAQLPAGTAGGGPAKGAVAGGRMIVVVEPDRDAAAMVALCSLRSSLKL